MAFKVMVTVDHDCKLRELQLTLNRDFEVYCNGFYDFFKFDEEITEKEFRLILDILVYNLSKADLVSFLFTTVVIVPCYGEDPTHLMHFYRFISEELGIMFAYPRISTEGERYLYHSLNVRSHATLLEKMQDEEMFQINSIEEYPIEDYFNNYLFSVPELANEITNRQMQILTEAYDGGYYLIPRTIRTEDIATNNSTSRYNIDKILRVAEKKIMQFIYPFLK